MEKLKEKYQFIIGFVAIIISLSSFKEELKQIKVNLSFVDFDLSLALFILIIGYLIVLQLYIIPYIFLSIFPTNGFLKKTGNITYFLFVLISIAPILLAIIYIFDYLIQLILSIPENYIKGMSTIFSLTIGIISGFLVGSFVKKYKTEKSKAIIEELENKEVKEVETTRRLIKDKYYNQAIIEINKTIFTRLKKSVVALENYNTLNHLQLLQVLRNHQILNLNEISSINELRKLRNQIVHENTINITENEIEKYETLRKFIFEKTDKLITEK